MEKWRLTLLSALGIMKLYAAEEVSNVYPYLQLIFPEASIDQFEISPFASYTNRNYLIEYNNEKYVLRLPGKGTEKFIDRRTEYQNAIIAYNSGFSAGKIIYFDQDLGVQLTVYVESQTPLQWDDFYQKPYIASAITLLKKIHESDMPFLNDMNVFERTEKLASSLVEENILPSEYRELKNQLNELRSLILTPYFTRVPCHNDPIPSNFVIMPDELRLFDWEYAGINDPAWELALLSCVMGYSSELEDYVIECYQSHEPSLLHARMILFKPVVEFWISLWAYSQTKIYIPSFEFFSSFADTRLHKCKNYLLTPEFLTAKEYLQSYISKKNSKNNPSD